MFKYQSQGIFMPSQKVVRFYVLKTVFLKNQVIQDMVLCHLVWFG